MHVLLDTHVLLWALAEPARLDPETRATIESGETEVLFSAASLWEIAIKAGLGRPDFAFDRLRLRKRQSIPGFPSWPSVRMPPSWSDACLCCTAIPLIAFLSPR
jgi:hypothetical protein